jgi:predicted enzyme related to lactoylglutathione lyase
MPARADHSASDGGRKANPDHAARDGIAIHLGEDIAEDVADWKEQGAAIEDERAEGDDLGRRCEVADDEDGDE